MATRKPRPGEEPQPSLPHENTRDDSQPYSLEIDDYDHGVIEPPKEQLAAKSDNVKAKKE